MGILGPPNIEKLKASKNVEGLIKALKDKDKSVREDAVRALGEIGDKRAIEPLIEALKDKDDDVRIRAASALGKIGEPAVEPLIKALKDEDMFVRWHAAEALGHIGDKRAVEPLIEALKYGGKFVRWEAAYALGKIGDKRAVELLIGGLERVTEYPSANDEWGVRQYARALEKTGDKRAVKPLIVAAPKYLELSSDAHQKAMKARSDEIEAMLSHSASTTARIAVELVNTATRIDSEEAYSEALKCGDTYILKLASEAVEKNRGKKE